VGKWKGARWPGIQYSPERHDKAVIDLLNALILDNDRGPVRFALRISLAGT
jgi:hypothetical protein